MATPVNMPPRISLEASAAALTRAGYRSATHAERALIRLADKLVETRFRSDPDDILSDTEVQVKLRIGMSLDNIAMGDEVSEYLSEMSLRVHNGAIIPWEQMVEEVNQIAERHGSLYGIPLPPMNDVFCHMVLAPGVPLSQQVNINQNLREVEEERRSRTETEFHMRLRNTPVRNSWHVMGDQTVCVLQTDEGPYAWTEWDAGWRLRKFFDTSITRSRTHLTAEAELRALESLKARITKGQYESYVLNGCFPEHSKRSDLTYFFRKGLPTIVVSFHGERGKSGKVLAALCLHPMGYYAGTYCGLMTPTDEVIAHLLLMRSDERKYWAKSGQWSASDSRSGI